MADTSNGSTGASHEIKPCPCGSDSHRISIDAKFEDVQFFRVRCLECGLAGEWKRMGSTFPGPAWLDAITNWNETVDRRRPGIRGRNGERECPSCHNPKKMELQWVCERCGHREART